MKSGIHFDGNQPHTLGDFMQACKAHGVFLSGIPTDVDQSEVIRALENRNDIALRELPFDEVYFYGGVDSEEREVVAADGTTIFTLCRDSKLCGYSLVFHEPAKVLLLESLPSARIPKA